MNGRGRQFFRGGRFNHHHQQGEQHHNNNHHHQYQQNANSSGGPNSGGSGDRNGPIIRKIDDLSKSFQGQKTDIEEIKTFFSRYQSEHDEIRVLFSRMMTELDQIKTRLQELESTGGEVVVRSNTVGSTNNNKQTTTIKEAGDVQQENKDKRKKFNQLKPRGKKTFNKFSEKRGSTTSQPLQTESLSSQNHKILNPPDQQLNAQEVSTNNQDDQPNGGARFKANRKGPSKPRRIPREPREPSDKSTRPPPRVNKNVINDDSTTQAAEPSSEDRPEGDDGREGNIKERVKVLRRKKTQFNRRGHYGNRGRRADSSERNSNDTSPQGEANGNDDYHEKRKKKHSAHLNKKTYPKLSEAEMNEIVQRLKREFINSERPVKAIRETIDTKGARVAYEFVISILDHAICDVTSPTKLSEIATNLFHLIANEDNSHGVDFQQAFYSALNNISGREEDIAIDAPRYMDTLGQVLADCLVPMYSKHRNLIKKFLNRCIDSYTQHNKATLLACIMKGIASTKDDRFAKELFDIAQLDWHELLGSEANINEFVENNDVKFTLQTFSPETRKLKRDSKELEKFADDVTDLVEKRCTTQNLDDLVKDLNLESDEQTEYLGTFIYAIVRGCLVTDSVNSYKLDSEALNKYSSILNVKHDNQDAIALHALTALTKLWHSYTSPRDLLRTILMELHNHGTASYEALNEWLNSTSLTNIPGIGAARLSSKRYIEDLGANLKSAH